MEKMMLQKNSVRTFRRGTYSIDCMKGRLWVTGFENLDIVLEKGDRIRATSQRAVCMMAFDAAEVRVRRVKAWCFGDVFKPVKRLKRMRGILSAEAL